MTVEVAAVGLKSTRAPYTRGGVRFLHRNQTVEVPRDQITAAQLQKLRADPAITIALIDPEGIAVSWSDGIAAIEAGETADQVAAEKAKAEADAAQAKAAADQTAAAQSRAAFDKAKAEAAALAAKAAADKAAGA